MQFQIGCLFFVNPLTIPSTLASAGIGALLILMAVRIVGYWLTCRSTDNVRRAICRTGATGRIGGIRSGGCFMKQPPLRPNIGQAWARASKQSTDKVFAVCLSVTRRRLEDGPDRSRFGAKTIAKAGWVRDFRHALPHKVIPARMREAQESLSEKFILVAPCDRKRHTPFSLGIRSEETSSARCV
jgi:hypothetical protein